MIGNRPEYVHFLQSYSTIVAIGFFDGEKVRVLSDGYYSATTTQHKWKFLKMLEDKYSCRGQMLNLYPMTHLRVRERMEAQARDFAVEV